MPTSAELALREALRSLLLPMAPDREDEVIEAARDQLTQWAVDEADQGAWVALEAQLWRETGAASTRLRTLIKRCLEEGDPTYGAVLAAKYFNLHKSLARLPRFTNELASALLSHARLIATLAGQERMTAAQITRVMQARDRRLPGGWQAVKPVLRALGMTPELTENEMRFLFAADSQAEQELFADADMAECARIVGERAEELSYPGALAGELLTLAPLAGEIHGPFLQMLHLLCVIAEYYDHALSAAYEFHPRSTTGPPQWLYDQYPPSLTHADNPFLNNSKSVDDLNHAWAATRLSGNRPAAHALASIIEGLESLGFAARRELAGWLRMWLCRHVRLARGAGVVISASLSSDEVSRLLARMPAGNTASRGIIEQRLVDCLAVLLHPDPPWLARGLGDHVNANNVSGRKFGDVDFQKSTARTVVAYEPHGGTLTDVYLRGHRRTVERVLPLRRAEWDENVASGQAWTVKVIFVAHTIDLTDAPTARDFTTDQTAVTFEAQTFPDFIAGVQTSASAHAIESTINARLMTLMAAARTPDMARTRLLSLIAP